MESVMKRATNMGGLAALVLMLTAPTARASDPKPITMDQAVERALETRPDLKKFHQKAAALEAKKKSVKKLPEPMLGVSTGIPFTEPESVPEVGVMVSQSFPLSGILKHSSEIFEGKKNSVDWMSKAEALDIALETRLAYIEIAEAELEIEVLHDLEVLAGRVVDASNAAVAAGGGSAAMVARSQVEVEKIRGEILGLEKKLEVMKQGFAVLIGADPDEIVDADFILPDPSPVEMSLEKAYAYAVEHRPELKAADGEVGSMTAAKKAAKDSYYPMMTIAAGYTYKSDKLMGLMGKDLFMISAGISLPIWIGKYKAEVKEAEAGIAAVKLHKEELEIMIKEQVAQAYGGLAQLLAQYDNLNESVIPQIGLAYDLQITSFSAASGSLTDVIDSLETLSEVSLMKVGLEGEIAKAGARLIRALGAKDYGAEIKAGEKSPKKGAKS